MSDEDLRHVYDKLCVSYQAIDDFRAKLLGFLPLATGSGVFLLYANSMPPGTQDLLGAIGAFGFAITLGLFAYEIHGIKKCDALIKAGEQLEGPLLADGLFTSRLTGSENANRVSRPCG
jgi:hypothetical protein